MEVVGEFGRLLAKGETPLSIALRISDSVDAYIDSKGNTTALEREFGSIGQWESCLEGFAEYLAKAGIDPLPAWDLATAISRHLDALDDGTKPTIPELVVFFDRAILAIRLMQVLEVGGDSLPVEPSTAGLLPSELATELSSSTATINKYAKSAGVKTPGRGRSNFRYSADDREKIIRQIANHGSDSIIVGRCKEILAEIESKSKNRK